MRMLNLILAGVVAATPVSLLAQAAAPATPAVSVAAQLTAGAAIYDPQGVEIAKVDSVSGDSVVVSTGTNKLTIPASSFGVGAKGPVMAATKQQLDDAAAQASAQTKAQLAAKLVPGAEVRGSGGAVIGTIKATDAETVTVAAAKGEVRVPLKAFSASATGVMLGMTAAEFDAAVAAAKTNG